MYRWVTLVCSGWIVAAFVTSIWRAKRGISEGRLPQALTRLKSPTIYLFAAYVFVAAMVTPQSPGESTSPLMWLSFCIPMANALAVFSSIGNAKPSRAEALTLAMLHAGALLAAAALILAFVSPKFVPVWLGGPGSLSTVNQ